MSTPTDQSSSADAQSVGTGKFPFPSIVSEYRLTLAPAELAQLLAVPEAHILALVSTHALETLREPNTREDWVTVDSLKRFLLRRLCGVIPENFTEPQRYMALRWFHQECALANGDVWVYPPYAWVPDYVDFTPDCLRMPGESALTPDQINEVFGWSVEMLRSVSEGLAGIVDIRLGENDAPLLRVPIESYAYWVRVLMTCGSVNSGTLLPEKTRAAVYGELGKFLGAKIKSSIAHDQN